MKTELITWHEASEPPPLKTTILMQLPNMFVCAVTSDNFTLEKGMLWAEYPKGPQAAAEGEKPHHESVHEAFEAAYAEDAKIIQNSNDNQRRFELVKALIASPVMLQVYNKMSEQITFVACVVRSVDEFMEELKKREVQK